MPISVSLCMSLVVYLDMFVSLDQSLAHVSRLLTLLRHHSHQDGESLAHLQQTSWPEGCKSIDCHKFTNGYLSLLLLIDSAAGLCDGTVCGVPGSHRHCHSWSVHSH